ncbi:hypothetical protein AGLY_006318 [Aphis glycines]|uniref:Uncharacterized protein n=1 Tax=Aphis glycines TaxID=307491 RepID=A0A6G0TT11_APHGL|nr:hypothetical protein AGLY_006318 [Aphis glycines]
MNGDQQLPLEVNIEMQIVRAYLIDKVRLDWNYYVGIVLTVVCFTEHERKKYRTKINYVMCQKFKLLSIHLQIMAKKINYNIHYLFQISLRSEMTFMGSSTLKMINHHPVSTIRLIPATHKNIAGKQVKCIGCYYTLDGLYNTSLTFVYTVIISLQSICFGVLFVVLGIIAVSFMALLVHLIRLILPVRGIKVTYSEINCYNKIFATDSTDSLRLKSFFLKSFC